MAMQFHGQPVQKILNGTLHLQTNLTQGREFAKGKKIRLEKGSNGMAHEDKILKINVFDREFAIKNDLK